MKKIDYYQPTNIKFGWDVRKEIGKIVAQYGNKCLFVTEKPFPALQPYYDEIIENCKKEGVEVEHFKGVIPNPTTDSVNAGVEMAKSFGANCIIGMGGGSSMDTAKAIAVGATHEGKAWDYKLFAKEISDNVLPVIAITTTSGTGSEVTCVAVVTNPAEQLKYALVSPYIFPKVSLIDPQLSMTVPSHVTASTGFDAFCHSFESLISINSSRMVDVLAYDSIKLVVKFLERAVKDGSDKEAREGLAWANTLGGLSIANSGTTLPHGIGMAIGGHAPYVMHGEALAIVYKNILEWTWDVEIEKFAKVARIFNPELSKSDDKKAAESLSIEVEKFMKKIGMDLTFESKGVPFETLEAIADDVLKLPDYTCHPKVADRDFYYSILTKSYK